MNQKVLPICVRSHPLGLGYETSVGYEMISVRNVKDMNRLALTLFMFALSSSIEIRQMRLKTAYNPQT